MKKKKLNKLSLNKKVISNFKSSKLIGGSYGGTAQGMCPHPSHATLETCDTLGTQCGGLTHDWACGGGSIIC